MKTIDDLEGNEISVEKVTPGPKGRRRFDPFSHLTEEERIDRACEILAHGVLRLAEKRGLTVPLKSDQ